MLFKSLFGKKRSPVKESNVIEQIKIIQSGDKVLRERFINDYKPFIIKTIAKTIGKYIEIENSEEYSIGLIAFNDAIDYFDENRNCNFFSYAELVIKRKLYTYFNSNKKESNIVPFSHLEGLDSNFEDRYLSVDYNSELHQVEVQDQYDLFAIKLSKFNISFDDLILQRPKHKDTLHKAVKIALLIYEDAELYNKLMKKKTIPVNDLLKKIKVNHKVIEKNRKFIISICIILGEGFEDIKEHINGYIVQTMKSEVKWK